MSAVIPATRAEAAPDTAQMEREILTGIARGGLLICETELRYQLRRRHHAMPQLHALLTKLERQGLIESEIHYRLTAEGAERVPAGDRPALRAISAIPWSSPPQPHAPQVAPSERASRRTTGRSSSDRATPRQT